MRPLSAYHLLRVWELGQNRPTWKRALLLLAPAFPDATHRELASLSIARRNARLFALRERTLGSTLNAVARCPGCSLPIEFSVGVRDLCDVEPGEPADGYYRLVVEGIEVHFRAPTSVDLAAVADSASLADARRRLVARCIRRARRDGVVLPIADLPDPVVGAVGDYLATSEPAADVRLQLDCPACGRSWTERFDIAAFFWGELAAQVQRIVREVDLLARAYGWRETEILAMSAFRRQAYLDLVNG